MTFSRSTHQNEPPKSSIFLLAHGRPGASGAGSRAGSSSGSVAAGMLRGAGAGGPPGGQHHELRLLQGRGPRARGLRLAPFRL